MKKKKKDILSIPNQEQYQPSIFTYLQDGLIDINKTEKEIEKDIINLKRNKL